MFLWFQFLPQYLSSSPDFFFCFALVFLLLQTIGFAPFFFAVFQSVLLSFFFELVFFTIYSGREIKNKLSSFVYGRTWESRGHGEEGLILPSSHSHRQLLSFCFLILHCGIHFALWCLNYKLVLPFFWIICFMRSAH